MLQKGKTMNLSGQKMFHFMKNSHGREWGGHTGGRVYCEMTGQWRPSMGIP